MDHKENKTRSIEKILRLRNDIVKNPILIALFAMLFVVLLGTTYIATTHIQAFLYGDNTTNSSTVVVEKDVQNLEQPTPSVISMPQENTLASLENVRAPRIIDALSIADVVPDNGKLIVADLPGMNMQLYLNGTKIAQYPLLSIGRPGTHWETPAGLYSIHTKERSHFSSIGKVYMPFSMQFFGNYFIHGRTYYPDGTPTASSYSGGCIRLETDDAEKVFDFAGIGTNVFVYDHKEKEKVSTLSLDATRLPQISAQAYLLADLDTGDVYTEQNAQTKLPIASITKLMTAIVANETISFNRQVTLFDGDLKPQSTSGGRNRAFVVEELMYPLLMSSSDSVANTLASYLGRDRFVRWMNNAATAYNMNSTTYVDAAGASDENVSTVDDLFRLVAYITSKKSFALNITKKDSKNISAVDGSRYEIVNLNEPANTEPFVGGKAGFSTTPNDAMLSLLRLDIGGTERTMVLIVLESKDRVEDTHALASWISSALHDTHAVACVSCVTPQYRHIEFP